MSKKSFKRTQEALKVRAIPTKKLQDGTILYRLEDVHPKNFVR